MTFSEIKMEYTFIFKLNAYLRLIFLLSTSEASNAHIQYDSMNIFCISETIYYVVLFVLAKCSTIYIKEKIFF